MTATEYIVLVDEQDQEIGTAEKLAAHEKNQLHRAFSIFIFRDGKQPEFLLQQRALTKYHSPGLWTNTCCSHPHPGEDTLSAGKRRLEQELAMKVDDLTDIGWFKYNAHFDNGLSEHEIDHVLIGKVPADIQFELIPEEVNATRWVTIDQIESELAAEPEKFTPWLKEALEMVKGSLSLI